MGGSQSDILHDFHIIEAGGVMIGLTLNETKCELITSNFDVVHAIRAVLPSAIMLIRVTLSFSVHLLVVTS